MFKRKSESSPKAKRGAVSSAPSAETPPPPLPDKAFFELVLEALREGLQSQQKLVRRGAPTQDLLHSNLRLGATAGYASALLRLQTLKKCPYEECDLTTLLNQVQTNTRRAFLYAGVQLQRPPSEQHWVIYAPGGLPQLLFEELFLCALRCSPQGRHIFLTSKPIGTKLMLCLRAEAPLLQQSPYFPQRKSPDAPEQDYGFAFCSTLAKILGWSFRWQTDDAGARMFLEL